MATSQQLEPAQPEATAISEPQNAVSGNPMAPTVETPRNTLMGDSGMGMPRNPTSAVISGPSSTLKPSPTPTVEASAACDEITSQGPTTMTNPRQNWSPEQVNHMLDFLNNSEPGGLISFLTEIYKHRPEEYMQVTQRTPVSANGFSEFGECRTSTDIKFIVFTKAN